MYSKHTTHTLDTTSSKHSRWLVSGEESFSQCIIEPKFSVHTIGTHLSRQKRDIQAEELAQLDSSGPDFVEVLALCGVQVGEPVKPHTSGAVWLCLPPISFEQKKQWPGWRPWDLPL